MRSLRKIEASLPSLPWSSDHERGTNDRGGGGHKKGPPGTNDRGSWSLDKAKKFSGAVGAGWGVVDPNRVYRPLFHAFWAPDLPQNPLKPRFWGRKGVFFAKIGACGAKEKVVHLQKWHQRPGVLVTTWNQRPGGGR